jgi:hypothetical protein
MTEATMKRTFVKSWFQAVVALALALAATIAR